MEDWYLWLLAVVAIGVTWLAWRVPGAPWWVGIGALSFLASGWWHDAGMPYGAAFGAFTNLVILSALFAYAYQLYELIVWFCFMIMLAIDLAYLLNLVPSHSLFAEALEAANWVALLSIGAAGTAERTGLGLAWLTVLRARPHRARAVYGRLRHALSNLAGPSANP